MNGNDDLSGAHRPYEHDMAHALASGDGLTAQRSLVHSAVVRKNEDLEVLLHALVRDENLIRERAVAATARAIVDEDADLASRVLALLDVDRSREALKRIVGEHKHAQFARAVDISFECRVVEQTTDLVPLDNYRPELKFGDEERWIGLHARTVLESTPLVEVQGEMLIAYMLRRFGYPNKDEWTEKNITASWLLTTPHPRLNLLVRPHHAGVFSFVPFVQVDDSMQRYFDLTLAGYDELAEGYRGALMDLLRSIRMQDSDFNALGHDWAEIYRTMGRPYDEDDAGPFFEAEVRDYMNGIPVGLTDGDRWMHLVHALRTAGNGDVLAGMEKAISMLNEKGLRPQA